MDKTFTSPEQIIDLFQVGIQHTTRLLDALKQEHQSLQHADPQHIELITRQKQEIIGELDLFAEAQNRMLIQLGYSTDRQGIESFLRNFCIDQRHSQIWNDLQSLLKKCQKQNEINSGIIALSKRQTNNALQLLYGLSAPSKTYGPTGESLSARNSNSLGKA